MRSCLAGSLLLLFVGCRSAVGPEDVQIRIHNVGSVEFDGVEVQFPSQVEQYGRVGPGERTAYRSVERAFRYAYIEVTAADHAFVLQPIDYVGETLLEPGRYTYELDLGLETGGVGLHFVKD